MPMLAAIDGDEYDALEHQPADYRITPLDPVIDTAADGTPIVSKRNGKAGWIVEWIWGDVVDPATVTELLEKRAGTLVHTISFIDKSGTAHSYNVIWGADPTIEAGPGAPYRPLTVRFLVVS